MMKKILGALLGLTLLAGATSYIQAQGTMSFTDAMGKLAQDAATNYVNPIVSGFGTDLNGGWFHRAPRAEVFGFDLEFGAVAMGTFFKDENKMFDTNVDFKFDNNQATTLANQVNYNSIPSSYQAQAKQNVISAIAGVTFNVEMSGPTVIGSKTDTVKVRFASRTMSVGNGYNVTVPTYDFATGITGILDNVKVVPLAAPQLSIGTLFGTQFTFRYVPSVSNADFGKMTYFGWGIQHNPGVWLGGVDALPFDVSASFFTQKLKFGDILQTKSTSFGVNVSKRLGWGFLNLTPYAGFMFESATMTFSYNLTTPGPGGVGSVTTPLTFDLVSANKSRAVVGLSFKLLIVNINADYNFGKYNSATAGVMIII